MQYVGIEPTLIPAWKAGAPPFMRILPARVSPQSVTLHYLRAPLRDFKAADRSTPSEILKAILPVPTTASEAEALNLNCIALSLIRNSLSLLPIIKDCNKRYILSK